MLLKSKVGCRHDMETLSALLSPAIGENTVESPVIWEDQRRTPHHCDVTRGPYGITVMECASNDNVK